MYSFQTSVVVFKKINRQFVALSEPVSKDWCTVVLQRDIGTKVFTYMMKKMNSKLVKPCPIYGHYEVEKFIFGRQYFITLEPNSYQYHFQLVDEVSKGVFRFVLEFELIDHWNCYKKLWTFWAQVINILRIVINNWSVSKLKIYYFIQFSSDFHVRFLSLFLHFKGKRSFLLYLIETLFHF